MLITAEAQLSQRAAFGKSYFIKYCKEPKQGQSWVPSPTFATLRVLFLLGGEKSRIHAQFGWLTASSLYQGMESVAWATCSSSQEILGMAVPKLSLQTPLARLGSYAVCGYQTKRTDDSTEWRRWRARWLRKSKGIRMVVQEVGGFSLLCSSATGLAYIWLGHLIAWGSFPSSFFPMECNSPVFFFRCNSFCGALWLWSKNRRWLEFSQRRKISNT